MNAGTKTYTIDAAGKKLGRVASQAAAILMGKNLTSFVRHAAPKVKVEIVNASKLSISEKHMATHRYARFSGYPGGLSFERMEEVIARQGAREVVVRAVKGMIPRNKLRPDMLKRLAVSE